MRLVLTMLAATLFLPPSLKAEVFRGGGKWVVQTISVPRVPFVLSDEGFANPIFWDEVDWRTDPTINLSQGASLGYFAADGQFPEWSELDARVSGTIEITSPGSISFGLRQSGFAILRVDGQLVATGSSEIYGTQSLSAGTYEVVVHYSAAIHFDAHLELFVATTNGSFASFAETDWELLEPVSDPSPQDVALSSSEVLANALAGSVVGRLSASDMHTDEHTFTLVSPSSDFSIAGDTLVVAKDVAAIPAGAGAVLPVTIRATSFLGTSHEETFSISVLSAANGLPTDILLDSGTLPDDTPVGGIAGILSAEDPDAGDGHIFTLVDGGEYPDNARFSIDGDRLVVVADPLAVELRDSYAIRVEATDSTGNNFSKVLTIGVTGGTALATIDQSEIPENAAAGALIGTITRTSATIPFSGVILQAQCRFGELDPESEQLLPKGATWRFLNDGSDLDTGNAEGIPGHWAHPDFDDSLWETGRAEFGYGEGDEATPLATFDVDPTRPGLQRSPVVYFRTEFEVPDPNRIERLHFNIKIDDGAQFFLNGDATYTDNLSVAGYGYGGNNAIDESSFRRVTVDAHLLQEGNNVMAVRLHQASRTSSDLSFDMAVEAEYESLLEHFYLDDFRLHLKNDASQIPLTAGDVIALPIVIEDETYETEHADFITIAVTPATTAAPTDIVAQLGVREESFANLPVGVVSATDPDGGQFTFRLVDSASYPDNEDFFFAYEHPGSGIIGGTEIHPARLWTRRPLDFDDGPVRMIKVEATDNTGRSYEEVLPVTVTEIQEPPDSIALDRSDIPMNAPAGTEVGSLTTTDPNLSDTHTYTFLDDILDESNPFVAIGPLRPAEEGAVWHYYDKAVDLGTAWRDPGYDDSTWPSGPSPLRFTSGGVGTRMQLRDQDPNPETIREQTTVYFRHHFTVNESQARNLASLQMRVLAPGIAVYLNGLEIFRHGISPNAPYDEFASSGIQLPGPNEMPRFPGVVSGATLDGLLNVGAGADNVIAAETHIGDIIWPAGKGFEGALQFRLGIDPVYDAPPGFAVDGDRIVVTEEFPAVGYEEGESVSVRVRSTDQAGGSIDETFRLTIAPPSHDADRDGLPDAWEEQHFGVGNFLQHAASDFDGDGSVDGTEFAAGTDPTDPADSFRITSIARSPGGVTLRWSAVEQRAYRVYRSADLVSWQAVPGGDVTANGTEASLHDAGGGSHDHYRIETSQQGP